MLLDVRYGEIYYPFEKSNLSTCASTSITFFDFDENELEHQKILKLALSELQKNFSKLRLEIFYKNKLISYRSPFYSDTRSQKYIFNQYLLDIYRRTVENLFELDFTKYSSLEFDVIVKENSKYTHYGRLLFVIQDKFDDLLKEKEIRRRIQLVESTAKNNKFSEEKTKRCKEFVLDPINYQGRRLFLLNLFKKFNLDNEEFQKLKSIIENYKFEISVYDSRKNHSSKTSKLTIKELEELLIR